MRLLDRIVYGAVMTVPTLLLRFEGYRMIRRGLIQHDPATTKIGMLLVLDARALRRPDLFDPATVDAFCASVGMDMDDSAADTDTMIESVRAAVERAEKGDGFDA